MTDVVIPAKINGLAVTAIENNAFTDNNVLRKVTIEEDLRSIGTYAFRRCVNLEEIVLPDSVTEIGDYVFGGCKKLEKTTLPKAQVTLGNQRWKGNTIFASDDVCHPQRRWLHCRYGTLYPRKRRRIWSKISL